VVDIFEARSCGPARLAARNPIPRVCDQSLSLEHDGMKNDLPSYSDARSAAMLASHRLEQKLDLVRDMERLYRRDNPSATPADFYKWQEQTRKEVGLA
jgi:hypothetical protein